MYYGLLKRGDLKNFEVEMLRKERGNDLFSSGQSWRLKNSLGMFASEEIEKVRVFGLQPGESTDNFGKRFLCEVEKLPQETRLIVLADIVGGSPLATICKVLDKQKMLENSLIVGGVNFPMALNALLLKETSELSDLKKMIVADACHGIRELTVTEDDVTENDITEEDI